MALIYGFMPNCTGIFYPKLPLHIQRLSESRLREHDKTRLVFKRISKTRPQYLIREGSGVKYALSVGRNHNELRLDDNIPKEPLWLAPMKDAFRALKSLFGFLIEQPSQLKHIEWPSFETTLKTATLTLVLVALLIVALSSVDAALWYLLTLLLRKPA